MCVILCVSCAAPSVLLVHGFGASLEHWRYNAPELAEDRPVFVIDLLGFGFSDKPTVPNGFKCWGGHVWARQLSSFVDQVIKVASPCP